MKKGVVYVVANWKMKPGTIGEAKKLFLDVKKLAPRLSNTKLVICPPVAFLSELRKLYAGTKLDFGAQDIHTEPKGSYTGEVSAAMVKSIGAAYTIVGHSEQRSLGDTNDDVNKKLRVALGEGVRVILCIGERERDNSGGYLSFLSEEVRVAFKDIARKDLRNIILAYEPIWAIGKTGKDAMQPSDVHETVLFLRKVLSELYDKKSALALPVLYGGSVEAENAEALLKEGGVNGFLVGHASLVPTEFGTILATAETA